MSIHSAIMAFELGFKAAEKGKNLQQALADQFPEMNPEDQARFKSYLPPAPEGHDEQCQKTRLGDLLGVACTCEHNSTRRRIQVENAGKANDQRFRSTLGSMEQHAFDMATVK